MKHRTTRWLLSLMLILAICGSVFLLPASAADASPSKAEIREMWRKVTSATEIYEEVPSISAPYKAGSLTDEYLETGITYINYVRFVAGLPLLELDDSLNNAAQHGAVLMAAEDNFSHFPSQPSDMDDAFYNKGLDATSTSNIFCSYGYSVKELLKTAVRSFMDDDDAYNNDVVGHRRWILNPTLKYVGFGYADSSSWDYVDLKVFDRSGSAVDYDFIGWPSAGNFPINLIGTTTPWSITLNPSKYQNPDLSQVKVTVTRQSDGKVWFFDHSTGQPGDPSTQFMTVDTNGYGVSNCIIFNPGSANLDSLWGIFTVDVTGIKTAAGAPAELHYQVDFFDVEACDHHTFEAEEFPATCTEPGKTVHTCIYCGEEVIEDIPALGHVFTSVVTEPTCTAGGFTTHTCTRCAHSYTDGATAATGHDFEISEASATCTTPGSVTKTCADCGHTETETVNALGHDYDSVVTDPTCTNGGYTTHTCSRCGDSRVDSATNATGHDYETTESSATCTAPGSVTKTCTKCGQTETQTVNALGHDYASVVTNPTCTAGGYTTHTCSRCADTYTDNETAALGHRYEDQVTAPTCTEAGYTKQKCTVCGHSQTVNPTDALGHNYESSVTDPTCTVGGGTTYTCTRCAHSYTDANTDPLGHNYESSVTEPTCTVGGGTTYTCTRCAHSYTDANTEPLGHDYESVVTEATCTTGGFTTYTCTRCGNSYSGIETPALGHNYTTEEVPPTCTEPGSTGTTCTRCGITDGTTIPALGHNYTPSVTAPTCTVGGYTTYTCDRCGDSYTGDETAALGHQWDEGVVIQEPTADNFGIRQVTCTVCGSVEAQRIAKLSAVSRIFGSNRYQTAFKAANALKEKLGVEKFQNIIVASGLEFPDALAGSYLATVKDAPILLVNTYTVVEVKNYIRENVASGGTVYLLGGTNAVSGTMESGLNGYNVVRLSGANRYETNLAILNEAGTADQEILVCTGIGFADSLSASAVGKPILLANPRGLTQAQKDFLAGASRRFVIIGGTSAVSADIEAALTAYGTVERLAGANRYETSVLVAQRFFQNPEAAVLAYAQNFPDGLCGGPLANAMNAPLLLTATNRGPAVAAYAQENQITSGIVLGGTGLIDDATAKNVFSVSDDAQIIVK